MFIGPLFNTVYNEEIKKHDKKSWRSRSSFVFFQLTYVLPISRLSVSGGGSVRSATSFLWHDLPISFCSLCSFFLGQLYYFYRDWLPSGINCFPNMFYFLMAMTTLIGSPATTRPLITPFGASRPLWRIVRYAGPAAGLSHFMSLCIRAFLELIAWFIQ